MSTKTDISVDNWAAMVSAAPAIARAVSASAGVPAQSAKELTAFAQFVDASAGNADATGVLGQLVADVAVALDADAAPAAAEQYMDGLEQARRAGAIIAVELDPAETDAIRAWYLAGAEVVAAAAREGGILGIGAKDISAWERDTIQSIADALGSDAA